MSKEYISSNLVTVSLTLPIGMLASIYALLGGTSSVAEPDKAPAAQVAKVEPAAAGDDVKRDAAGTPFDPERHTGSIVKSGLWRLKAGLSRGPGEDVILDTGTSAGAAAPSAGSTAAEAPVAQATGDAEDDEFAAFHAAASGGTTAAAPVGRKWTLEDLSKLTNQAAVKLGDPAPVKEVISKFTPAGEVPHSRNIPENKRAEFAAALEAKAGITFEG